MTTQAVTTALMRRYVEAARVAPCRRAHDVLVSLATSAADCQRCGAHFDHVLDALTPEQLQGGRRRVPDGFPLATSACGPGSFAVGLPPSPRGVEAVAPPPADPTVGARLDATYGPFALRGLRRLVDPPPIVDLRAAHGQSRIESINPDQTGDTPE